MGARIKAGNSLSGEAKTIEFPPDWTLSEDGDAHVTVANGGSLSAPVTITAPGGTTNGLFIKAGRTSPYDALSIQGYDASHVANMSWFAPGTPSSATRRWYSGFDAGGYDFCLISHVNVGGSGSRDVVYICSYDTGDATEHNWPSVGINTNNSRAAALIVDALGDDASKPTLIVDNSTNVGGATAWLTQWKNIGSVKSGVWHDGSVAINSAVQPTEKLFVGGNTLANIYKPNNSEVAFSTAGAHPHIYASGGTGTYPFAAVGSLVIQGRSDAAGDTDAGDVVIATGQTAVSRLVVKYDGRVGVGNGTTWGGATGPVLALGAVTSAPNTTQTGVAVMYVQSSALKVRIPQGTIGFLSPGDSFKTITYAATMTPDAYDGKRQKITVTNGTAMTIANPTSPFAGATITLDILNSSGGAMGAITWGAAYLLAGAFTNPANGKRRTITFYYDGTNWVEESRAAADI